MGRQRRQKGAPSQDGVTACPKCRLRLVERRGGAWFRRRQRKKMAGAPGTCAAHSRSSAMGQKRTYALT